MLLTMGIMLSAPLSMVWLRGMISGILRVGVIGVLHPTLVLTTAKVARSMCFRWFLGNANVILMIGVFVCTKCLCLHDTLIFLGIR